MSNANRRLPQLHILSLALSMSFITRSYDDAAVAIILDSLMAITTNFTFCPST